MSTSSTSYSAAIDPVISSVATKYGMGGGAVTAAIGWLSSSGAAVLIGVLVTVLGFIVNYIFQRRRDKRESQYSEFQRQLELSEERRREEMHIAQLEALRKGVA